MEVKGQEAPVEVASMPRKPPRRYRLRRIMDQEGHGIPYLETLYREIRHTLSGPNSATRSARHQLYGRLINVGVIIKNVLRIVRVKKGKRFSFGVLLTRFLREQQIDEKAVDYRPRYDLKELYVIKTKDLEAEDECPPKVGNLHHRQHF
ncbi:hypothetical protein HAX54_000581, partial [Datura stramonium]|nr:hypothetical protein [Datura stramonium]